MSTNLLAERLQATARRAGVTPASTQPAEVERAIDALATEIERREAEARARAEARVRFDLD